GRPAGPDHGGPSQNVPNLVDVFPRCREAEDLTRKVREALAPLRRRRVPRLAPAHLRLPPPRGLRRPEEQRARRREGHGPANGLRHLTCPARISLPLHL